MKIYLDCEYNDFKGELISIGLASAYGTFYASLGCKNPSKWVAEHVIPVIGIQPEPLEVVQHKIQKWLSQFDTVHIIADWPEDIAHFCNLLITKPGYCLNTPPITMELRRDLNSLKSGILHNALADAIAIMEMDA